MSGHRKLLARTLARAMDEARVYGCTVHLDPVRPMDGRNHYRLIITDPISGKSTVHTAGGSPKSKDAMIRGVGDAVRRKARALVGEGPTG